MHCLLSFHKWRKELQAKLEEDEVDEVKGLKEKQLEEEVQQRDKEAAKQRKFQPPIKTSIDLAEQMQLDMGLHRNEPHLGNKTGYLEK